MSKFKRKSSQTRKIALNRVNILFDEARKKFSKNKDLANRYVTLARKISMKFKLKLPSIIKRQYCKHCKKYLFPGKNLRVRNNKGQIVYYCLECKKFWKKRLD